MNSEIFLDFDSFYDFLHAIFAVLFATHYHIQCSLSSTRVEMSQNTRCSCEREISYKNCTHLSSCPQPLMRSIAIVVLLLCLFLALHAVLTSDSETDLPRLEDSSSSDSEVANDPRSVKLYCSNSTDFGGDLYLFLWLRSLVSCIQIVLTVQHSAESDQLGRSRRGLYWILQKDSARNPPWSISMYAWRKCSGKNAARKGTILCYGTLNSIGVYRNYCKPRYFVMVHFFNT